MTIPQFNQLGYLPVGIYDCTLHEIERRFGSFKVSDRRVDLFARFKRFVHEARRTELVVWLIINGSFVSDTPLPNDIDLIVVVPRTLDIFAQELLPIDYSVLSQRRVRTRYNFDVFVDAANSDAYKKHVRFFQQIKDLPNRRKGCLRLRL